MEPFLKQVAGHYYPAYDLDKRCFVFPNRRSSVFFGRFLSEEVAGGDRPAFLPRMYTMDAFFSYMYGTAATDRVSLLLELYDCYREVCPGAEPLDEFIFWGDVLLGDFDDVDKYLVHPGHLFANVSDFKGLQDGFEYLTEAQREAITRLAGHFAKGSRMAVEFFRIWDILLPLYTRFRERLQEKGMAYPGMLYRSLAEQMQEHSAVDLLAEKFPGVEKFVFVGLNALSESERTVLRRMQQAGLAEFCWDFSSDWVRDKDNKSSFFMARNVADFPQAFPLDPGGLPVPVIHVVGVPSSTGQAKQVSAILEGMEQVDRTCAVVLPDESLLPTLLSSIPPKVEDINVTMGYPMSSGALFDLMSTVATLQLHLRKGPSGWMFYHRQVWAVFSNSLFRRAAGEAAMKIVADVKRQARYYIPEADLAADGLMRTLFRPVLTGAAEASAEQTDALAAYLQEVVSAVATAVREEPDIALELEFARKYYLAVSRLRACALAVLPQTFIRLLGQLLSGATVPFRGEPLKGLQVMGPLETRALDFRNLIILSCNEGLFPRKSVSASFIPPELRKGFGLPTYEFQDAVWAYYFYRLLQRSQEVWLLYDTRSEKLRSGEESRYIKQLRYHFKVNLDERVATAGSLSGTVSSEDIPKSPEDVATVRERLLSASALKNYLDCGAKFYFATVRSLEVEEAVQESLDAGMMGNVFHKTMEDLYSEGGRPRPRIDQEYLTRLIAGKKALRARIREHILEELRTPEVSGRNLVLEDVILQYVLKTLQCDLALLQARGVSFFRVLGLEEKKIWEWNGFHFIGFIDRIDSFRDGEVRIVDYKTGRVADQEVEITDGNAAKVVEALFGPETGKRPKIALQMYLYDQSMEEQTRGKQVLNVLYPVARLFAGPLKEVPASAEFGRLIDEAMTGLLDELTDLSVPWRRTTDPKTCSYCDFKNICGR